MLISFKLNFDLIINISLFKFESIFKLAYCILSSVYFRSSALQTFQFIRVSLYTFTWLWCIIRVWESPGPMALCIRQHNYPVITFGVNCGHCKRPDIHHWQPVERADMALLLGPISPRKSTPQLGTRPFILKHQAQVISKRYVDGLPSGPFIEAKLRC